MRPYLWFVLLAGLLGAAGCSVPREKTAGSLPTPAEPVTYTENGWSADQRREFYHLPEGSELMPYVLLSNVVSVKTGKPFLEDMERFGFVPDARSATNPHGLPVGITTVHSRDKSLTGLEMTGFNCAACHVGEITYHGTHLRIDGAPSLINLQAYQVEFRDSLDATLRDPKKLLRLAIAIDRQEDAADTPSEAGATGYASDPSVQKGGDVAATPTADASFHSVSSAAADAASSRGVLNKPSFRERLRTDVALLKARLSYLKNGKLLVDGTEPGPGRVDAFGAARNLLFPANALKMQSPVSFPFIWGVPDTTQQRSAADMKWIHYDGNTNSILERNIGQALGMGAVFDPATYESTLRIANLHRLEVLTHELKAPAWPAGLLGPIDQAKAKAGEQIFNAKCRDCHQGRLYNLLEVGTDPQRANSFGQPVQGHVPFPKAIQPILDGLKARAFADDGISPAQQAGMDASPVVWRATGQYMARPLHGVWATAPYLHNGSVPTLYDLLHPEQRPAKFSVGGREYDPVKVGYASAAGAAGWTFDTSQPGNSNIGHSGERFGTTLTEEQKAALIEYLKGL